jgi:CO/xanthine dehydrogenase FAD-binding subunit
MVLEASIPETPLGAGWSFKEFARRFGDFAIVGVAVLLVREQEEITDARIALTGVGDKPWRDSGVERMLVGQKASTDLFAKIGVEIAAKINPGSDIHASESYRRSLATVLTRRALNDAWQKARNEKWG